MSSCQRCRRDGGVVVGRDARQIVACQKAARRQICAALDGVCRHDGIRLPVVALGISCRHLYLTRRDAEIAISIVNRVVGSQPRAERCARDRRLESRRPRIRRWRRQWIDRLRDGRNRIAIGETRRRILRAHVDAARAVHIRGERIVRTIGAALVSRLDKEVALRDVEAAVDVVDVVVRRRAHAEGRARDLRLEPRRAGVRRDEGVRRFRDVGDRIAVHETRRPRRGVGAELRRAARIGRRAVLRTVDARLVARIERQIALRDGKAAVVVADVIVRRQSRAEDGARDFRLEACRARIRRDGRSGVDRLRDGGNRIAVDEAARLDAEGARAVHIGRRIVCRTVDAALVACSERQRTLRDAERAGGVGDRVVIGTTRCKIRTVHLRPKPRRARVRRDERSGVDRLRDVIDGIAVDESRRRRRRTDVDLARAVHVACRRVSVAVDAALVARRDREGARLDLERPRAGRDVVVRRKAAASFCQLRSLQRHRVMIADARALRDGIGAVHRHNAVGGKAVTGDERAGVRRRGAHDDRVVRRAVDALAVRCGEMDVDGIDRELTRNIFEIVVGRLERAV